MFRNEESSGDTVRITRYCYEPCACELYSVNNVSKDSTIEFTAALDDVDKTVSARCFGSTLEYTDER